MTDIDHTLYVCVYLSSPPTAYRIHSDHESHAISAVEWYVHDNGIFTTSSVDKMVRIWDTNELCVVEKFKFSGPVYTHSMASSESHCLIAGEVEMQMHCTVLDLSTLFNSIQCT